MAIPLDKKLYEKVKAEIYKKYPKNSAYRSGAIVKEYKRLGGEYEGIKPKDGLTRWYKEKWVNVDPLKSKTSYPVYRPSVRVNSKTPLLASEIDKKDLIKKSKLKQIIKGNKNLPPFIAEK